MIAAAVRKLREPCDWTGLAVKHEPTDTERGRVLSLKFNVDGVDGAETQPVLLFEVQMPKTGEVKDFPLQDLLPMLYEDPGDVAWENADTAPTLDVEYAGLAVKMRGFKYRVTKIILVKTGRNAGRIMFTLTPSTQRGGAKPLVCMLRDIKLFLCEFLEGDVLRLYKNYKTNMPCFGSPAPSTGSTTLKTKASSASKSSRGQPAKPVRRAKKAAGSKNKAQAYIGQRVRKFFENPGAWYEGTVKALTPELYYRVVYDDEDVEEYTHEELLEILVSKPKAARKLSTTLGAKKKQKKKAAPPKRKAAAGSSGATAKKAAPSKPADEAEPTLSEARALATSKLQILKPFPPHGLFRGTLDSAETEVGTGRVLYHIVYEDGDAEDMYYEDMLRFQV